MSTIGSSVLSALNAGSGINTASLVSDLVAAVREPKEQAITSKQSTNNARISALASASSSLTTFSTTLTDLLKGTGFSGTPASNDPSIAVVSALNGGTPKGLPAQLEVMQLASAQVLESIAVTDPTQPIGLGTLTLTTASGAKTITIDSSNNSLNGLAGAINSANAGVTATVVTDNQGSRLVLKGATGEDNAFTLTADTADADLQRFTFDGATGGMTKRQSALDSIIKLDGVEMHNSGNTIDNALPFVRIDLNKAAPGTQVTLATDQPTTSIRDLVSDFVAAYNTLRSGLNSASITGTDPSAAGALAGDAGIRDMKAKLARLTSTELASTGTYRTLADLGVSTNRDGTLKLDTARLDAAIQADPEGVTKMLNPPVSTTADPGLAGALKAVTDNVLGEGSALTASQNKYKAMQETLSDQLDKLDKDMDNYEARLTATYAKMETQLSAFKATQTYLEQQIAVWNGKDN